MASLLRWARLALVSAMVLFVGCATTGGGDGGWLQGLESSGLAPWRISPDAYPSQRLYRVKYEGPEGRLGFKLTLYLESETQFHLRAADSLGRRIWELAVDDHDEALWLDHREKQFCRAPAASGLAVTPLARLPLVSLPKLLLGRIPGAPVGDLRRTAEEIHYLDMRGREWNGGLVNGHPEWWHLVKEGEVISRWRREGEESLFTDVEGSRNLRWREVVRERLSQPPPALVVPGKFRQISCL